MEAQGCSNASSFLPMNKVFNVTCPLFPSQFPSFIHSQKRNPQTHMKDPDMVWDFWSLRPESLHQVV